MPIMERAVSILLCLAAVAVGYTSGSRLSGIHQVAESAAEE